MPGMRCSSVLSSSLPVMYGCFFLLAGLGLAWLGPAAADVHDMVGPQLRGLGIAVYFFAVNVLGYGIAPPIVGWLSDRLGTKEDPHQMALALLICPAACVLAAVMLWRGSRVLDRGVDVPPGNM